MLVRKVLFISSAALTPPITLIIRGAGGKYVVDDLDMPVCLVALP